MSYAYLTSSIPWYMTYTYRLIPFHPQCLSISCSTILYFTPSFIYSVFCLTTGPKPPPKRCLHIVRSRSSSFKWEYPLLSLRSSSSFLRLLPRLLATSISLFIFPSTTCFRRQFLRIMWPIQLAFRFLISCTLSLRYLINVDQNNGYSPRVAISCDVSEALSTMKSAVFTMIMWSQTERNLFLPLFFTFCCFNYSTFCPYTLNPKI